MSLTRALSSETYEKLLANPNLNPQQRAQLEKMKAEREAAAPVPPSQTQLPVQEQLEAAIAERDALLELKRKKEETRKTAEASASLGGTRSAEKAAELAAAKEELARLKAMKSGAAARSLVPPSQTQLSVQEQLEALIAERDALLELKRKKEETREAAEASASLGGTRSAEKAAKLAAAKEELARLKAMKSGSAALACGEGEGKKGGGSTLEMLETLGDTLKKLVRKPASETRPTPSRTHNLATPSGGQTE